MDAKLPELSLILDSTDSLTGAGRAVADPDPEAPALIVYTSGTTGRPKGAVLSHRALLSNLTTVAQAWHWTENDRLLLTLPCFHLHGLGLGIMTSFLVGSSVALRRRFVLEEVLADLARSRGDDVLRRADDLQPTRQPSRPTPSRRTTCTACGCGCRARRR